MRTDIDHLPPHKQRELECALQIIFEEYSFSIALASTMWKKRGTILKIILYGSYARESWTDDPKAANGYRSQFDLLIIVSDTRLAEQLDCWRKLDHRFVIELLIEKVLRTPADLIVQTLRQVNHCLAQGAGCFVVIADDGFAIYESDLALTPDALRQPPSR